MRENTGEETSDRRGGCEAVPNSQRTELKLQISTFASEHVEYHANFLKA